MSHAVAASRVCGVLRSVQQVRVGEAGPYKEDTFSHEKISRLRLAPVRMKMPCGWYGLAGWEKESSSQ